MTLIKRVRPALGLGLTGLALGAVSLPPVAIRLAEALGEPPRRALDLHRLSELAWQHLQLAGTGFILVALAGIAFGILATRDFAAAARPAIDSIAAGAQAVPPVVVVALALPVLGFGGPPTLLALVAYGVMPVLRGTVGGIQAVSPDALDAARAVGLTKAQILTRVELPLAWPVILEALRTALVLAVATAAVGALAGASTLGTPIIAGLQNQNTVPMLQGAAATAALAFLGDAALILVAGMLRR
ncbi:ABC transporter permease subunit [Methylobacterium sp. BTF04]|uniref:ABC transporter permease n=1 Tax=Methylobacterium sp. BTF04 TaxID=2708300 RepID=UPI0013D5ECD7|nr:ABC transporter permease subunit [Methylobacterium sp. BTF04]NEU10996.1 ABC transporter permease subunit [Methylobacterium sp. BTF04]